MRNTEEIVKESRISEDIKNRVAWFQELEAYIYNNISDKETAAIIFRRIVFEEKNR